MYLLDTDTLSSLLKRRPSTGLIVKLASIPPEQQFTSSITIGELIYGAHRQTQRTDALLRQFENILPSNLPVLPFDDRAARRYGAVRAHLERQGAIIGDADIRIASIALTRDLTVVTGNLRHFQRIPGLVVENWLQ